MVILNTVNSDLDFLLNFRILKTDTCKSHKTTTKFVYLGLCKIFRSLLGNVIKTVRSKGSDYWAAYFSGEKIKTDGLKRHTRTDVITH